MRMDAHYLHLIKLEGTQGDNVFLKLTGTSFKRLKENLGKRSQSLKLSDYSQEYTYILIKRFLNKIHMFCFYKSSHKDIRVVMGTFWYNFLRNGSPNKTCLIQQASFSWRRLSKTWTRNVSQNFQIILILLRKELLYVKNLCQEINRKTICFSFKFNF